MLFFAILIVLTPLCLAETSDPEDIVAALKTLQVKVEQLENKVEKVEKLENEVAKVEQLENEVAKVEQLENHVEMQDLTINTLKTLMNERFASVEKNLEAINSATVDTLFLATIAAESIAISDDEPIIFDTAPINPGDNYNPVLGAYTAPETGYYQFSVAKRGNNGRGDFWLLIDEERFFKSVTYSTNGDADITSTATINIELTAGQIVRVENDISSIIYGTNSNGVIQSYFTGYMLYAL